MPHAERMECTEQTRDKRRSTKESNVIQPLRNRGRKRVWDASARATESEN